MIDGIEAMLNGVVSRIDTFIGGIDQGWKRSGPSGAFRCNLDLQFGSDREPL